jgi:hypothetical protein
MTSKNKSRLLHNFIKSLTLEQVDMLYQLVVTEYSFQRSTRLETLEIDLLEILDISDD